MVRTTLASDDIQAVSGQGHGERGPRGAAAPADGAVERVIGGQKNHLLPLADGHHGRSRAAQPPGQVMSDEHLERERQEGPASLDNLLIELVGPRKIPNRERRAVEGERNRPRGRLGQGQRKR